MSEPEIAIELDAPRKRFASGELLSFAYQVLYAAEEPSAVEVSVLWYTEGKGDEDLGVHFFDRVANEDGMVVDFRGQHRYSIALPNSPLSYEGRLVKIRWCVRVRAFFPRGSEAMADVPFQLGTAAPLADVKIP